MYVGGVVGGRFELERLAGVGGMGEVFRALDRQTGARVALKRLIDTNPEETTRFVREAHLLSELDHPHVVRYVAHGVDILGTPWLAMEWLAGEDLRARLDRGPLRLAEAVDLARRTASALGAAHARGIIHRDIKPSNLFLPDGRIEAVKLLDFGVAWTNKATHRTATNVVLGTPGYVAPEQTRGGVGIDARADIFALGAVLFEAITGEPAFKGDHVMAILTKILFEEPPRLREWQKGLPETLDALVSRMLSKDPALRPANGSAAEVELGAIALTEGLQSFVHESAEPSLRDQREALTDGERRAIAVVLIGAPEPAEGAAADALTSHDSALREVAMRHGGRFEGLLDGSAAVLLSGTSVPTDLCAQAARCALALRDQAGGRAMALAMERAEITSKRPVSGAIEKAVRMLVRKTQDVPLGSRAPIGVDDVVAGLLDAVFEVRTEGESAFLFGERKASSRSRTLLGKPTSFVGRDRELRSLEETFEECVNEPLAQAVLVTAAPGIGKTRLAHELCTRIADRVEPTTLWVGRADALRAGSTFSLLQHIVAQAAGLLDGEPAHVRRDKLLLWVSQVATNPEAAKSSAVGELLGEIAGVSFPDDAHPLLAEARKNPDVVSEKARVAWLSLLGAALLRGPVVVLLEDLQWGDLPSVQLFDRALRDFADRPLFVLALARPAVLDIFPKLWSGRRMQEMRLRELPRRASVELAKQVLGENIGSETLERIVRLSEGNAFYLEELIRASAVRKGEALPESVVAMVQSRLSALDEALRRILRAASVLGEVFWAGAVAELVGGASQKHVVEESLRRLAAEELITAHAESRFPGETEYAFRHALHREGAYVMLLDEDRALGHRLAAGWLAARGERDPRVLAEHYELGKDAVRAAELWHRAAERAGWARDTGAAIRAARRGLDLLPSDDVKGLLLGLLCYAYLFENNWAAADACAAQVIRLAKPGSAAWAQSLLARLFAAQAGVQGDEGSNPLAVLDLLLHVDPAPDAVPTVILSLSMVLFVTVCLGRYDLAFASLARIETITASFADDPSEPSRSLHEACWPFRHLVRGLLLWHTGDYEEAARELRLALTSNDKLGPGHAFALSYLAEALSDAGAYAEAKEVGERLLSLGVSTGFPGDEGRGRWVVADALRGIGDLEGAYREAKAGVGLLRAVPLDCPPVLATLAATELRQGRAAEALAHAREAFEMHVAQGHLTYRRVFVMVVYAQCLLAMGDEAGARDAALKARGHVHEIAETIADPLVRERFLERVIENRAAQDLARRLA